MRGFQEYLAVVRDAQLLAVKDGRAEGGQSNDTNNVDPVEPARRAIPHHIGFKVRHHHSALASCPGILSTAKLKKCLVWGSHIDQRQVEAIPTADRLTSGLGSLNRPSSVLILRNAT